MGRIYTPEFENQSVTNAGGSRELFYIAPADDKPVKILGWQFTQISDVGDAQEEILRLRLIRGHTTVGSGGTALTAANIGRTSPSFADPGFTARHNDTTLASAGTAQNQWSGGFNVRIGDLFLLPEKLQWVVTQAQGSIVLRLMAAPADDITLSGTLFVEEDG